MGKSASYPQQVVVRITTTQDTFVRDIADLHGVKPSDVVRALIEDARQNHVADGAIQTLDQFYEEVDYAQR